MNSQLLQEVRRKAFHMLSLVYLEAYVLIGYPRVLAPLMVWAAVVAAIELGRLRYPALNDALFRLMEGLSRSDERDHVSGILHTTFGALALILLFGGDAQIVTASIFCVAFGDAAAALVGKTLGSSGTRLLGDKSVEGTSACFIVCFVVCLVCGYGLTTAVAAATAASAIELLPTTPWFNDNFWIPLGAACALRAFA